MNITRACHILMHKIPMRKKFFECCVVFVYWMQSTSKLFCKFSQFSNDLVYFLFTFDSLELSAHCQSYDFTKFLNKAISILKRKNSMFSHWGFINHWFYRQVSTSSVELLRQMGCLSRRNVRKSGNSRPLNLFISDEYMFCSRFPCSCAKRQLWNVARNLENVGRRTHMNEGERLESWRNVCWGIKINESAHPVGAGLEATVLVVR